MKRLALTAIGAALLTIVVGAQSPPPVNGPVVPEVTSNTFYRGAQAVLAATIEGIQHVYEFTKDLILPGKHGGDALADLREGTTVVVQDKADAKTVAPETVDDTEDAAAHITEGTVTKVDRRHDKITVRFSEGKSSTFHVADAHTKAPAAATATSGSTVVISYACKDGPRVSRLFTKVS